jgi:UDP-glucose:(heptosyl)LPS alpha-1,3-glucosyltransferase
MGLTTPGSEDPVDAPARPLRIALVIERSGAGTGGAENVAWQVAAALARAGDDVTIVSRGGAAPAGVTLRRVASPGGWQPLRLLAFSRAAAAATRDGFDVVQSFSRTLHQHVFRAGGGSHADYLERLHGRRGARLRRLSPRHASQLWIERRVFRDATQVLLCNSTLVRDQISSRYGVPDSRLVVIRNGVDLARFHPERRAREGARLRGELAAGSRTVWLFAGSGFPRKGLDIALGALAATRDREAVLWVAGRDDPARWQALTARLGLRERVQFLGPRADLPALFAAADGLLLPTRYDAFANVCLEAAAAGIPVVTSGANGAAEIAHDAGIVVEEPEDVAGFARALDALAEPAARSARGKAGREIAQRHDWDAHVRALRALYQRRLR